MILSAADFLGVINDEHLPVIEENYNAVNYVEYLDNKHFHHSGKGCDVVMVRLPSKNNNKETYAINKYCKTHDQLCSKTGWEIGYYLGTKSIDKNRICRNCKEGFLSVSNEIYCDNCKWACRGLFIFLNNNKFKTSVYSKLNEISLNLLLELKEIHKNGKLKDIINYQIKHKKK